MTKRDTLRNTAIKKLEQGLDAVEDLAQHCETHPAKDKDVAQHHVHACNHARDRADRALRGLRDDFNPDE